MCCWNCPNFKPFFHEISYPPIYIAIGYACVKDECEKTNTLLNLYQKLSDYQKKADEYAEKLENEVTDFIHQEWRKDLCLCVEVNNCGVLAVWVGEDISKIAFEQFIIKPICDKYNLKISYCENVTGESSYIEWGLSE